MRRILPLALYLLAAPALAQQSPPDPNAPMPVEGTPPNGDAPVTPPPPVMEPAPNLAPTPAPAPAPPANAGLNPNDPLAGYNGSFFLRDPNDWFVLYPKGRLQIDSYNFLNRGDPPSSGTPPVAADPNSSKDPRPVNTLFVRRARIELQGTIANHFDFHIAGEFASVPGAGSYGTVADAYVIVNYFEFAQLQVGQFDAPFTLENRTSDKYFDFMERSVVVRSFGVPSNKEDGIMLFGWLPKHVAYYSLGIFNGDGQNFKSQDDWPAFLGRAFISPLALVAGDKKWMNDVWIGGSFWWHKSVNLGGRIGAAQAGTQNDYPGMSTQGGFGFFSSSYGNGALGRSHLVADGDNVRWAVEINVPILNRIGVRGEMVGISTNLAQYNDTNPMVATMTRSGPFGGGHLEGLGGYLELFGWILGDGSMIETPGLEPMPHMKKYKPAKEPMWGLMAALKIEHIGFDISGLQLVDGMGKLSDPALGHYGIDVFEIGLNAWCTKHVRITANYVANFIGGFDGGNKMNDAKNLQSNFYYGKTEHELLFRIGINL